MQNPGLDGEEITGLSDKAMADFLLNHMGFIFQQMNMMKNLTVLDNVVLPAIESNKLGESKEETIKRGEALMKKFGIIDTADKDINEVSGGQLQRACIARNMINQSEIIFADEPTGALNRTSSNEVMDELVKINQEGATIMMVTHDSKVASRCTRVLYLVDGNIRGEYELGDYFDSFFRGANSSNKGSGLGLYIAKKLMFAMNGDIYAVADGEWLTVTVVFKEA